ncbi:MAG: tetratricopeptide repeat protein [Acidobacteriota bacterium]
MRPNILALAMLLVIPLTLAAQRPKNAAAGAAAASKHYGQGWNAMRSEAFEEAVREFQQAIDADPKFTLAYYSLGRAEMALKDFPKAIAAYTRCRDIYLVDAGEQFNGQMSVRRNIDDRIREYQSALRDAQQRTSLTATTQPNQSVYVRELQAEISRLEQARDRNINLTLDTTVPYFVPMALGAAYFRNRQFVEAEREDKLAIAANSSSGEAYSNLAVLYLVTGRLDEAEKAIAQAKKTGFKVNPQLEQDIKEKKRGS